VLENIFFSPNKNLAEKDSIFFLPRKRFISIFHTSDEMLNVGPEIITNGRGRGCHQGDQIRRNFLQLDGCLLHAVFFENYRSSANVWTTFTQCISDVFIVTKNGLGHVLGDFFSQTHPVTLAATANDLPFINNYLLSNFSLLPKHAPQKKIHA
jgi:hypothetical protein